MVELTRALALRRARKDNTRSEILAGAILLTRVEQSKIPAEEFRAWLDTALTRADDRTVFGLNPKDRDAGG